MKTNWMSASLSLPGAGASVDFLLLGRRVPLCGTFSDGSFRARWADYNAGRVESWMPSEDSLDRLGQSALIESRSQAGG
jgi:hypothetical protein